MSNLVVDQFGDITETIQQETKQFGKKGTSFLSSAAPQVTSPTHAARQSSSGQCLQLKIIKFSAPFGVKGKFLLGNCVNHSAIHRVL